MTSALMITSLAGCGTAGSGGSAPGATATSAVAASASAPAESLSLPEGYQLVWSDEFDRGALPDESKWVYDTGMNKQGWHNREQQYYSGPRAENAELRDGRLVITARKEARSAEPDWGGQPYSSTRLLTKGRAEWTYGYFEIRAKLPCGKGSWPAIWTLGHGEWPAAGELDIMEHIGREPTRVFSTVHTTTGHGSQGVGDGRELLTACSDFHNYQMLWTPTEVRFAVDGRVHATYRNAGQGRSQWPFDAPQFLIINLAIGGNLGGEVDDASFPLRYEVDYVRVYQRPAK